MFENRQGAADDHGGDNSVPESKRALYSEHGPVVSHGSEPIDRADESKRECKQPNRESDADTSANEFAAPPHLHGQINRGESADESTNKQGRVNFSKQDA